MNGKKIVINDKLEMHLVHMPCHQVEALRPYQCHSRRQYLVADTVIVSVLVHA